MIRRGFYFFILLLSFSASAQSYGPIKSKTFYFDVDNFSLTQESMKILRVFIDEVKNTPIEIVEIIGYVEENSAIVYNKIRSKKRIDILKHSLDNSITVYQYKPLNIDYAPAFLYSYEDGYNWRKVDITYRQIIEINPNNKDFINVAQNKITKKDEPFIPLDKNYNSEVNQGKNESYQ
ncbi:hypothetical protein N9E20_02665, partial [Crocinitomicaceae bacterium]|nr:hypothetical protein [Crocinitomicaceae bacterium]